MSSLKEVVRKTFKKLHRTRLKVFAGDYKTLTAARLKINEEFKKNIGETDKELIKKLIQFGEEVEEELRTKVIQAREVRPGVYETKITEDTVKLNNIPFNINAIPEKVSKGKNKCCQDVGQQNDKIN